jgi:peroxiredoxin Q/BCP
MAQKKLKVNDSIPTIELFDQDSNLVKVSDLLHRGPVVIYFYPKDDTPGCTKEACSFRDQYEAFTDKGVQVIGISADHPQKHKEFAAKHNLPFILLSDVSNEIRKAFGVPSNMFGLIPGRVTYVVDQKGIIRGVFNSQSNPTQHVHEALKILETI